MQTELILQIATLALVPMSGMAVLAFKYTDAFEILSKWIFRVGMICWLAFFVADGMALMVFGQSKIFIDPDKLDAAKVAFESVKTPTSAYLIVALAVAYNFFLEFLMMAYKDKIRERERENH